MLVVSWNITSCLIYYGYCYVEFIYVRIIYTYMVNAACKCLLIPFSSQNSIPVESLIILLSFILFIYPSSFNGILYRFFKIHIPHHYSFTAILQYIPSQLYFSLIRIPIPSHLLHIGIPFSIISVRIEYISNCKDSHIAEPLLY